MLNQQQRQLYLRNIILPEIGEAGQEKLLNAKVLVIGAGGLGSSVIQYLACAGVGNIGIVDNDIVEISNLQRQIIHNFSNLGDAKVLSAKQKIASLAPDVKIVDFRMRVNRDNLALLLQNYDIVVDATDNFPTRFVINEVCFKYQKPLIFGAVKGFQGHLSVFKSYQNNSPCYACFNPNIVDENFELPLSEKGILGAVAGTVGAMQATNTIKEILQIGDNLVGKIQIIDFLKNNFRQVALSKNLQCPLCGVSISK